MDETKQTSERPEGGLNVKITQLTEELKEIPAKISQKLNDTKLIGGKHHSLVELNLELSNSINSSLQYTIDHTLVNWDRVRKDSAKSSENTAIFSENTKKLEKLFEDISSELDAINVQSSCLASINRNYCEEFLKKHESNTRQRASTKT